MEPIIEKDRYISLISDVNENDMQTIIDKINTINIEDDKWYNELIYLIGGKKLINKEDVIPSIKLYLSTYGGSVYDGFALYDTIKDSSTPVNIECSGKIMSMGIIIMLASKVRKAHKNTTFMIHTISSGMYGQLKNLEEDVDETRRLNNIVCDIICQNTKITNDKLKDIYEHKKDWYISAQEALELGLITEII